MTSHVQYSDLRVCVFEVAGAQFGLRLQSVVEIVPMVALSRPPSMPSILEGFLNLRGTAVPVLRIAALFGLPHVSLDLHTPLVIARAGTTPLALLVNRVLGIVTASSLVAISETDSFNGCVEGHLTTNSGVVQLLSMGRLLAEKERRFLVDFQATAATRLSQFDDVPS